MAIARAPYEWDARMRYAAGKVITAHWLMETRTPKPLTWTTLSTAYHSDTTMNQNPCLN